MYLVKIISTMFMRQYQIYFGVYANETSIQVSKGQMKLM